MLLRNNSIAMVKILQKPDEAVEQVAAALKEYEKSHEGSECLVYRYNPASIRVKIIDATFHGRSKGERHDDARGFLSRLPESVWRFENFDGGRPQTSGRHPRCLRHGAWPTCWMSWFEPGHPRNRLTSGYEGRMSSQGVQTTIVPLPSSLPYTWYFALRLASISRQHTGKQTTHERRKVYVAITPA